MMDSSGHKATWWPSKHEASTQALSRLGVVVQKRSSYLQMTLGYCSKLLKT